MTIKYKEEIEPYKTAVPSVHISRDIFCDWQTGKMKESEETAFLGHIGACTFCAEQFGKWMEEGFYPNLEEEPILIEPPRYLKEEILNRAYQMDVKAAVKLKETSRKVQLLMYSLKVGLAVAASLFLLVITTDIQNANMNLSESQRIEQMQERQREAKKRRESREREEDIAGTLRRGSKKISNILNDISSGWFRMETEIFEN